MVAKGSGHGSDNRQAAHLGVALVTVSAALILGTVWFLPTNPSGRTTALTLTAGCLVVVVALARLPWERLPDEALLAFPLVGLAALTIGAVLNRGISPAYSGLFTVAVFYVASTQALRLTMFVIAAFLPLWVVCQGGISATVAVKIPITLVIWVLVGQSLGRHLAASEKRMQVLEKAATTDPLTGFGSRNELAAVLHRTAPGDAVVLMDLDGFKAVNDSRGHQAGDEILADFGRVVRTVLRSSDLAVRYGGDEVMLLLQGTDPQGAASFLERLRANWSRFDRPSFSAGVAVRANEEPTVTLLRADKALYDAKARGRDRWSYAAEETDRAPLRVVR